MLIVASKRLHQKFGPQTEQMTGIREFEVYPEVGVSGKVHQRNANGNGTTVSEMVRSENVQEYFGVEPSIIGVGPAVAIQTTARNAGLEVADIDPFEINEMLDAFQYLR
ncbi:hypothetical protein VitviT2T_021442 [Vitis vinifera]|uniref:Thiolase C-terminal domain-containing protein n=1 Tax=Vitis vinifera TaxID=29760 RepID=A0ABY9D7J1_VITVI|nr:hypothetical protein VitviT2T_021442 [Vitis vinifera]